jgi:hypothetical protein
MHKLKPGEELQVILFLLDPFDASQVVSDIGNKNAKLLTPVEDTSNMKVVTGGKEELLALLDFDWLDLMIEDQQVHLIE